MAKITKTIVDRLTAGQTVWDGETRGFGVRRRRRDTTYVLKYRVHRRQRFLTIGRHGAPWTVDMARKEAQRLLGLIAEGKDPAAERDRADKALTVSVLAEAFLSRHVAAKRKAKTLELYRSTLTTHVLPDLGNRKAIDVTRADVARLHSASATSPYAANYILAVLSAMYAWAGNAGLIDSSVNPARRIERFGEQHRERFLSADEFDRLGAALREAETIGLPWDDDAKASKHTPKTGQRTKLSPYVTAAMRLLIFSGCRLREILTLEWQQVDFERGELRLPDSKTGRKTVVLSAPALAVLASLDRPGRYVIVSGTTGTNDEKPRSDLKRPWAQLTKRAGLAGVRIHDLRHTFASVGAGANMSLPMIGRLLGHTGSDHRALCSSGH